MVEEIKKTSNRSKKTSEVRSSSQALQKASVKRKPSAEQTKAKPIVPKPKKVKTRADKKIKTSEDNIQKKEVLTGMNLKILSLVVYQYLLIKNDFYILSYINHLGYYFYCQV